MRINSPKVYTKTDEKKPIEKKRRKNIKKNGNKKKNTVQVSKFHVKPQTIFGESRQTRNQNSLDYGKE